MATQRPLQALPNYTGLTKSSDTNRTAVDIRLASLML